MKLTRDSVVLSLTAAAAALGFLMTMPPPTHWSYQQWLQVALGAVLWIAGKLGSSPLTGRDDDQKIKGSGNGPGFVGAILVCILAGATLINCSGLKAVTLPASVPLAVDSTDAQLRAAAQRSVEMLAKSQELLIEVVKAEKAVEASMPASVKADTRAVLHHVNDGIVKAATDVKTAAHTWQDITAAVTPVTAEIQRLVDLATNLRQSGGFGDLAGKLLAYVKSIIAPTRTIPALQGARS